MQFPKRLPAKLQPESQPGNLRLIRSTKMVQTVYRTQKEISLAACPAQTFSNITAEQYANLVKEAQTAGVPIDGHCGTASKLGGNFSWKYDHATLELTITVNNPPFLMSCESVNQR